MSYLNLNNYNDEVSNISSQYTDMLTKANEAFDVKNKANEIVKTLGEAKTFISGKPVAKYLLKKGVGAVKDAVKDAGVKLNDARTAFQDGKSAVEVAGKVVARDAGVAEGAGANAAEETAVASASRLVANQTYLSVAPNVARGVGDSALAGAKTEVEEGGARLLSNPNYISVAPSEGGTDFSLAANDYSNWKLYAKGQAGDFEDGGIVKGEGGGGDAGGAAEGAGNQTLSGEAAVSRTAGIVTKADQQFEKTLAGEGENADAGEIAENVGKTVGKTVVEDESIDAGGTAAVDGIAGSIEGGSAAIPVVDVIGAIVGIGLTIGAIIKKPKEMHPVDSINASFQTGV